VLSVVSRRYELSCCRASLLLLLLFWHACLLCCEQVGAKGVLGTGSNNSDKLLPTHREVSPARNRPHTPPHSPPQTETSEQALHTSTQSVRHHHTPSDHCTPHKRRKMQTTLSTHHQQQMVSHARSSARQPFAAGKQCLMHPHITLSRRAGRHQQQVARAGQNQPQTTQQQKTFVDMTIDDLDTSYCDDFVCTSSPAVETTVRSLVSGPRGQTTEQLMARCCGAVQLQIPGCSGTCRHSRLSSSACGACSASRGPGAHTDSLAHPRAAFLHMPAVAAHPQARDISRLSYNTNFFQPDVTFSDGLRSFKGRDKYKQDSWARAALKQPKGVSFGVGCAGQCSSHAAKGGECVWGGRQFTEG
jgi:hypothetical protein